MPIPLNSFLDHIDELFDSNRDLSDEMFLRGQPRTMGLYDETISINNVQYRIFDLPGGPLDKLSSYTGQALSCIVLVVALPTTDKRIEQDERTVGCI